MQYSMDVGGGGGETMACSRWRIGEKNSSLLTYLPMLRIYIPIWTLYMHRRKFPKLHVEVVWSTMNVHLFLPFPGCSTHVIVHVWYSQFHLCVWSGCACFHRVIIPPRNTFTEQKKCPVIGLHVTWQRTTIWHSFRQISSLFTETSSTHTAMFKSSWNWQC